MAIFDDVLESIFGPPAESRVAELEKQLAASRRANAILRDTVNKRARQAEEMTARWIAAERDLLEMRQRLYRVKLYAVALQVRK